jgi:cobalt/nickel transport system permease protein
VNVEIERLARLDTWVHHWDARWKIVAFSFFILIAATVQHVSSALIALLISIFFIAVSQLPWRTILKRLAAIHFFLIPCFLILPFEFTGFEHSLSGFSYSREGLHFAFLLYLRAISVVNASLVLLYSTPMQRFFHAGERLGIPRPLVQIAMLTYRFIFTFTIELQRIRQALIVRGFQNLFSLHSWRTLAHVVGMLLIRSLERTDKVYHAMKCRGYHGEIHSVYQFTTNPQDISKSAILFISAMGLFICDRIL